MARTIRSTGHVALCQAITETRKRSGLTQAGLAERLRCHQSLVARIESGERRIDVVEMVVLARAIGVPAQVLLQAAEAETAVDHRI